MDLRADPTAWAGISGESVSRQDVCGSRAPMTSSHNKNATSPTPNGKPMLLTMSSYCGSTIGVKLCASHEMPASTSHQPRNLGTKRLDDERADREQPQTGE